MSSPSHHARHLTKSLGRTNITGAALRRGELKISDPMPCGSGGSDESTLRNGRIGVEASMISSTESVWPRKTTTSPGRSRSSTYHDPTDQRTMDDSPTARLSLGPSTLNQSMSSAPSRGSLSKRKDGGFRATLRKIFGPKRQRDKHATGREDLRHSVSVPNYLQPPCYRQKYANHYRSFPSLKICSKCTHLGQLLFLTSCYLFRCSMPCVFSYWTMLAAFSRGPH